MNISQLTVIERRELHVLLWWARRVALADDQPYTLALRSAQWASAAYYEGARSAPIWLIWLIGLSMSHDPLDQRRLDQLFGNLDQDEELYTDPDFESPQSTEVYREVDREIGEALSLCRSRWLLPLLYRREGRDVVNKLVYFRRLGHENRAHSTQLLGLYLSRLLTPLALTQSSTSERVASEHLSTPARPQDHSREMITLMVNVSIDAMTLALAIREPLLLSTLASARPRLEDFREAARGIKSQVARLISHRHTATHTTSGLLTPEPEDSSSAQRAHSNTSPISAPLVFSQIVKHFEHLNTPSRRLAFERLLKIFTDLGQPPLISRSPSRNTFDATSQRVIQTSTTGGLRSISRRGALEQVCRSEVVHLGHDLAPGIDGFMFRWLQGDLLFYQRDQREPRTRIRAWTWRFYDPPSLSRNRLSVSDLDIAHLISLWVQRSALLELGRDRQATTGFAHWVWTHPHGVMCPHAAESRQLISLLAMADVERGLCSLNSSGSEDDISTPATLEFMWMTSDVDAQRPQSSHAILIDLCHTAPMIHFPHYWRRVFACPPTMALTPPSSSDDQHARGHSQIPAYLTTLTDVLLMILNRWFTMSA